MEAPLSVKYAYRQILWLIELRHLSEAQAMQCGIVGRRRNNEFGNMWEGPIGRSEENCEFAANCDDVSEPLVHHDLKFLTGLAFR